jgi:hypothetical protein
MKERSSLRSDSRMACQIVWIAVAFMPVPLSELDRILK